MNIKLLLLLFLLPHVGIAQEKLKIFTYGSFNYDWGPGPNIQKEFEQICDCDLVWSTADSSGALLSRIKLENDNLEILPGSLLEASIKYNVRNSLSIPDTSIMLEGNKVFVYTVSKENIANKTQIKIGIRHNGNVEVISGLNNGDSIVAEGLKKVRPRGKIKPIKR